MQDAIKPLLKDDDQYLRIDAIRTLATIDNERTRQILRDALLDSQPLVQQAAEAALQQLTRGDTVLAAADPNRDTVRLTASFRQAPSAAPVPPATASTAVEVAS